ncbi:hypothetical protein EJ05DRAFT_480751 [Pseudovirgaria hyperparasitica]|uniref:Uncharacterized protein n=1 Tax=Pseudovirgaria hyperparasitica TaxID=470096 RepID=A0A6A6VTB6_9PEZI|nr:uncharacterized protein EJ05DRAFT_480751 [Pseudovirgaria hyperparasitica]KAF2753036.1 hypothetical protein EJ05DRAFT_480751 [Pseudovirgaria hyperparasitica]
MNFWLGFGLILLLPITAFFAFLILSSCMGDRFRARVQARLSPLSAVSYPGQASFGRTYARSMMSGAAPAGWEQIEMEDMMSDIRDSGDDER